MTDLEERLERVADAGVAGIALHSFDSSDPERRTRTRGLVTTLGAICVVLAAIGIGLSVHSSGSNTPPVLGDSKLVADAEYTVPSAGMSPTLQLGDVVSSATRFDTIERGDVVRVRLPAPAGTTAPPPGADFGFKRVVGLPGDVVEDRNGAVFVNGAELQESYVSGPTSDFARTVVPADSYFVLGDNRPNSKDSREWGAVKRTDITAIALRITAPAARIGAIPGSPRSR